MNVNIFLFSLILLLVNACGGAERLAGGAQPGTGPETGSGEAGAGNTSLPGSGDAVWDAINQDSVESGCLQEARERAGASAWAVGGCDCAETAASGVKEYECAISTLEGTIPVHITCALADRACAIESSQGNGSITFDELAALQAR